MHLISFEQMNFRKMYKHQIHLKGKVGGEWKFSCDKSVITWEDHHRSFIVLLPWLIKNRIATVCAVLLDLCWCRNWILPLEELIWAVLELNLASLGLNSCWYRNKLDRSMGKRSWSKFITFSAWINFPFKISLSFSSSALVLVLFIPYFSGWVVGFIDDITISSSISVGTEVEAGLANIVYLHKRRFPECQWLHELYMIPIITVNPGQAGLPNLKQLLFCHLARAGKVVIVESVSMLQPLELVPNDALECWS